MLHNCLYLNGVSEKAERLLCLGHIFTLVSNVRSLGFSAMTQVDGLWGLTLREPLLAKLQHFLKVFKYVMSK